MRAEVTPLKETNSRYLYIRHQGFRDTEVYTAECMNDNISFGSAVDPPESREIIRPQRFGGTGGSQSIRCFSEQ